MNASPAIYGLVAEFLSPDAIMTAAERARDSGYRRMDAYTPLPVEGLSEVVGFRRDWMPLVVLLGGLTGCAGGYLLQVWGMVWSYPINVGGRPLNSWPAFIPVTFEMTILLAALFAVFGLLALSNLPMPYHPLFNVRQFTAASRNRFFLCILARDPLFDEGRTRKFLESLGPVGVYDVEP